MCTRHATVVVANCPGSILGMLVLQYQSQVNHNTQDNHNTQYICNVHANSNRTGPLFVGQIQFCRLLQTHLSPLWCVPDLLHAVILCML